MAAPEAGSAPPEDAEALATARAGFWAHWRRDTSSDADVRRPLVRTTRAAVSEPKANSREPFSCLGGPRRQQAESLRLWIERRIAMELDRCERCMTPDEWCEHREWIEDHARGSLWAALTHRSHKGML